MSDDRDVLLHADGRVTPYPPAACQCYTIQELRSAIGGGWFQIVRTWDDRLMVLDEEGKLKGFPVNEPATDLYQFAGDPIVGDVLVCESWRID